MQTGRLDTNIHGSGNSTRWDDQMRLSSLIGEFHGKVTREKLLSKFRQESMKRLDSTSPKCETCGQPLPDKNLGPERCQEAAAPTGGTATSLTAAERTKWLQDHPI